MKRDFPHVPLSFHEHPPAEMCRRARSFADDLIRRRTVRDFADRPVPRDIIEAAIDAARHAPSGANHQPWHFVAVADLEIKRRIRAAAETEEKAFYAGRAAPEWLEALKPLGTDWEKPFLQVAPWLIVIFAEQWGRWPDGRRRKNYYVPESTGIAAGFLLACLHHAGLATLTHTPNPMGFLGETLGRPKNEKAIMIVVAGYPAADAVVPTHALQKKPLPAVATFL
ncbi:nitroreductase family protein [Vineibacter terrae]|uniref:Nitroreductase family protein n=1 Tax=Vineibacter terrae TaxID=2586908 RepID=A0A5C8PDY4_9HYPH|nr:nitroreductase family protein [Vineibacter terrae]TXL71971.1 nitroreductase family protein [Vineibacter terrae]